jgi:uncharacterized surface protein with fasciclin (FAS1) repeats
MKSSINKWLKSATMFLGTASLLVACNKDLPDAVPNETSSPTGQSITELLNDADYLFLKTAVEKAAPDSRTGYTALSTLFSDKNTSYTFFAPSNNAFRMLFPAGTPDANIVAALKSNAFSAGRLDTLLRYHLVGGTRLASSAFPTTFPNISLPTTLVLAPPSAAVPPGLRMPIFPSNRNGLYVNNVPVIQPDVAAANGVIHKTAAIVAPPTQLVAQILAGADYSYLRAAIARADEGQTGLNKFDSVTKYAPANITVLAPTNDAFQQFLTAMGLPASEASISMLPVATARAIVAYHLMGVRAFSVNMPATPTFIPTLVNVSAPTHPGVNIAATVLGPGAVTFTVTGVGNGGAAATVVTRDLNAVNGVVHRIDRVLLPQ